MAYLKPIDLYTQWRAGTYLPVYLFAGEELYLIEEACRKLKAAMDVDTLNIESFSAADTPVNDILLAAQTLPFLSSRRLIFVKELQEFKAAELHTLAEFLKNPGQSSCLVLLWSDRVKAEHKRSALFTAVERAGAVAEFRALYDRELPDWIRRRFADQGRTIQANGVDYLIKETGQSLLDITNEIDKIILFCGQKKAIELKDVEMVSGHTRQFNLNNLSEAVESKDLAGALKTVEHLLREGEPALLLLATVYRAVKRLAIASSLQKESGYSAEKIREEMRLHPYFDRSFFNKLSGFTPEGLERGLGLILQADLELKTSSRPDPLVLEELLVLLLGGRH